MSLSSATENGIAFEVPDLGQRDSELPVDGRLDLVGCDRRAGQRAPGELVRERGHDPQCRAAGVGDGFDGGELVSAQQPGGISDE